MNNPDKPVGRPLDFEKHDTYPELEGYVKPPTPSPEQFQSDSRHADGSGIMPWLVMVLALGIMLFIVGIKSCHAQDEDMVTASYYTTKSCQREGTSGVRTASGERYDEDGLTCAMRRRDWGTRFKVTNLDNGKSVIVRLNDFGPNKKLHDKGRIIDLSKGAFERIASLGKGVIRVKVEELK